MQQLLAKNKPKLKKIYKYYATQDTVPVSVRGQKDRPELSLGEFIAFARDINAFDGTCTLHNLEVMFQRRQREQYTSLLDDSAESDTITLLKWVNQLVDDELTAREGDLPAGLPRAADLRLRDFCQGFRALRTYWTLLAAMSPGHVSDEELVRALDGKDGDIAGHAKRLLAKAAEMGISGGGVTAEDLLADVATAEQHEAFISGLFSRFCGAGSMEVQFRPRGWNGRRKSTYGEYDIDRMEETVPLPQCIHPLCDPNC